jgi:hypothetical protein
VDNGTKRSVGDYQRETYKLTFALPATLPNAVYPLTVKMYTGTLVPVSDNTATATHGFFNVAVEKKNLLDATDQSNQWNYNANKWDSWYEFVISEPSVNNSYTVYLNAFVEELFPELIKSTVGLYFEIDNFGARIPLYASAPQPTEKVVTFNAGSFSVSNHSGSLSSNGVRVSLSDCDGSSSYITTGYSTWYLLWTGYTNGKITVTATDNSIISRIVLNYNSSSYTGGTVTPNTGNFSKSGTTGTWTGAADEVQLAMGRTDNNEFARVSSIVVTSISY